MRNQRRRIGRSSGSYTHSPQREERGSRYAHSVEHGVKIPWPSLAAAGLRSLLLALSWLSLAGCGVDAARLDDAQLGTVRAATPEDLARLSRAEDALSRSIFAGAVVNDRESGRSITFTRSDYDAFQQYRRAHDDDLGPFSAKEADRLKWPMLRISFLTHRPLIEPGTEQEDVSGALYFCDAVPPGGDPFERRSFLNAPHVMWHGRFVTDRNVQEVQAARAATPQPQEYEFIALYTHAEPVSPEDKRITVLPPSGDLCFALVVTGFFPESIGLPLRIDRAAVSAALGPLPRQIPIRSD